MFIVPETDVKFGEILQFAVKTALSVKCTTVYFYGNSAKGAMVAILLFFYLSPESEPHGIWLPRVGYSHSQLQNSSSQGNVNTYQVVHWVLA